MGCKKTGRYLDAVIRAIGYSMFQARKMGRRVNFVEGAVRRRQESHWCNGLSHQRLAPEATLRGQTASLPPAVIKGEGERAKRYLLIVTLFSFARYLTPTAIVLALAPFFL
jgi:hypothetical protein